MNRKFLPGDRRPETLLPPGGIPVPATSAEPAGSPSYDRQVEVLEIRLLLEAVYDRYGYDFRDYDKPFLRERIRELLRSEGLPTITSLQERLLHDQRVMDRLLISVSLDPVPLFDNPAVFSALRRHVMPVLRDTFFVRAWQVGCATGERAFSLAITMHEEGLGEKSRIYVTDLNGPSLRKAKQGLLPLVTVQARRIQYLEAGGTRSLDDYYTASFDSAVMAPAIRKSMVFAQHNLVTDGSINEFQLIMCTSILSRFSPPLQARVLGLLHESLASGGFLMLAPGETPRIGLRSRQYEAVDEAVGLFRREY